MNKARQKRVSCPWLLIRPEGRQTLAMTAAAKRDLAVVTHIPGDIGAAEIERRYQTALQEIRWRRCAEHST